LMWGWFLCRGERVVVWWDGFIYYYFGWRQKLTGASPVLTQEAVEAKIAKRLRWRIANRLSLHGLPSQKSGQGQALSLHCFPLKEMKKKASLFRTAR
jgi:hypothetical protein